LKNIDYIIPLAWRNWSWFMVQFRKRKIRVYNYKIFGRRRFGMLGNI